jgi:uncharacterized protein YbaP (TraB family)
MVKLGFTPQQVDQMEPWQVAAILGVDIQPEEYTEGDTFLGRQLTEADKERLRRFNQTTETEVDITERVAREMGINFG